VVDCCAAADVSTVVMVVVAITIAAIRPNTYTRDRVTTNDHVCNTFMSIVLKFGIYLDKKPKVDEFYLLAPKRVNFFIIEAIDGILESATWAFLRMSRKLV
jgi:hypothetical protein